jgi:hypothetical protein
MRVSDVSRLASINTDQECPVAIEHRLLHRPFCRNILVRYKFVQILLLTIDWRYGASAQSSQSKLIDLLEHEASH